MKSFYKMAMNIRSPLLNIPKEAWNSVREARLNQVDGGLYDESRRRTDNLAVSKAHHFSSHVSENHLVIWAEGRRPDPFPPASWVS